MMPSQALHVLNPLIDICTVLHKKRKALDAAEAPKHRNSLFLCV